MLISLDTDKSEVDHREIGQDKINKLMDQIQNIPEEPKFQKRVTVRCTLARENAPYFAEFVDNLYERGIRRLVVHPLILDSARGFIQWTEQEWNTLHKDILNSLDKYEDLQIHFSEGVGKKGEENCMIGSDMIAIDASGDFSGCYFFTNQKGGPTADTILGNIFNDTIYIDRYKHFQKEYAKMFEEEEQCKTCDYKNACYQCPAGNLDTGTRMFRPDDMCQKIVKLYVDLQEDIAKKQFKIKYDTLVRALHTEGYEQTFLKAISYMLFYYVYQYHPSLDKVHNDLVTKFKSPQRMLGFWTEIMEGKHKELEAVKPEEFLDGIEHLIGDKEVSIDDFYYDVLKKRNMPTGRVVKVQNQMQEVFFLALLHVLILASEDRALDDAISYKLLH
jgi:radical SAM protein with 4Fe4S-binding SPASM domain